MCGQCLDMASEGVRELDCVRLLLPVHVDHPHKIGTFDGQVGFPACLLLRREREHAQSYESCGCDSGVYFGAGFDTDGHPIEWVFFFCEAVEFLDAVFPQGHVTERRYGCVFHPVFESHAVMVSHRLNRGGGYGRIEHRKLLFVGFAVV